MTEVTTIENNKRRRINRHQRESRLIGMSFSTAKSRLTRALMFHLVKQLGQDVCFRCKKKIETLSEFSIDHKITWLGAQNPAATFFDLDNIAFSHWRCNSGAAARPNKKYVSVKMRVAAKDKRRSAHRIARKQKRRDELRKLGLPYS